MPKVNLFKTLQKDNNLKIAINKYMILNNLDAKKISKQMDISLSSFYKKMKAPYTFRIDELRKLNLTMDDWGDIL